jgi:hypothetical protein
MSRIWAGFHWSFDITAGHALGLSVADYIFQNYLLPHASPAPGGRPPWTVLANRGTGVAEEIAISPGGVGVSLPTAAPSIGLPFGQPTVYAERGDATRHSMVTDTPVQQVFHARAGNFDDVFRSADPWDEAFASAPR